MTYQAETVTVKLPIPIYRRLKRVAEITYRSVEDVLASTVDAALPLDPNLPSDVADDVAAMALMNDDALMAASEVFAFAGAAATPATIDRVRRTASAVDL